MPNDIYGYDPLGGYNVTPATQRGSGAYGAVPGPLQIPPNLYQQIGAINPLLAEQTGTANQTIMSELMGELSPATKAAIQQNAASFGAAKGMPLSQFAGNYGITQLGLNVEKMRRQGIEDYLGMLRGTGETLTPQQLASEIASRNATMAAAPDPTAAAMQQMSDWQNKFNQMSGGGGGFTINPSGGRGAPMGEKLFSAYESVPTVFSGTGGDTYNYQAGLERAYKGLPTGATFGGVSPTGAGALIDANGDEWVPYEGQYMNLTTGAMQANPPAGVQPVSRGTMYMGEQYPTATTPGIYMGGQTVEETPQNWVTNALGFDTSGMSQDDIDLLAYIYGYGGNYGQAYPTETITTPASYDYGGWDWYNPSTPDYTYYNPTTDTSNYGGFDWYDYGTPAGTYYEPATDTSNYDYGQGFDWYGWE